MKNKKSILYGLALLLAAVINSPLQAQQENGTLDSVRAIDIPASPFPKGIVRTIVQDRKGNTWITSWEGVYKYDGKSFTNVTGKVSSARFFSVLEDRKGNFWFGSIGSGVYYYDGKSFQNFTTREGLANNSVTNIYEDKAGNTWFGTGGGASRYDGKLFQTFKMNEAVPVTATDSMYTGPGTVNKATDSMYVGPGTVNKAADSMYTSAVHKGTDSSRVSVYENPIPKDNWMHNDVNAVVEDNTGRFWFGTRGYAAVYDGKKFITLTNNDGQPFKNVRTIIKDKKGNMWLGGNDGLWRYDGRTFTNYSKNFVGYIYEDKKGNLWISSGKDANLGWTLSRYDGKSLQDKKPMTTTIANKPMIFGISEDDKGNIWFGCLDGVYLYDGKTITEFKSGAGN